MGKACYKLFIVVLLLHSSAMLQAAPPLKIFTLGIYAYRPKQIMLEQYQPLVDYLNAHISACCEIKLKILELSEIEQALADKQLDFLFTNPKNYSGLKMKLNTLIKANLNF